MKAFAQLPLARTQVWLLRAIDGADEAREEGGALDELRNVVRDNAIASAEVRLNVYRFGYLARLEECLADDYPAVKAFLGEERFSEVCKDYVAAYPSRSPSLNAFGQRLPAFVRDRYTEPWCGFVVDLARLEWALVEVIHAPAAARITLAQLAAIEPARLAEVRFRSNPAVRLECFRYPVGDYLQRLLQGNTPEGVPEPQSTNLLIVRRALPIRRVELDDVQTRLLDRLLGGAPLGGALTDLDVTESSVHGWFRDWMSFGVFDGVSVD